MRHAVGLGLGWLARSTIEDNLRPVVAELGLLSASANSFNGQIGQPAGAGIAAIADIAKTGAEAYLDNLYNFTFYANPLFWSQLGAAFSLGSITWQYVGFTGTVSLVADRVAKIALTVYNGLPQAQKARVNNAIGHPGGIQSIEIDPDLSSIGWQAFWGDLNPEQELRIVREAAQFFDAGNNDAAASKLHDVLAGLRKYGEVRIQ